MNSEQKIRRFRLQKIAERGSGLFLDPDDSHSSGRGSVSGRDAEVFMDQEAVRNFLRENQKMIAMGRQAASIVHEINNPLESMGNLLYLLGGEKDLSEQAKTYLALAQRELDRVIQISKQTLNFYRDTPQPMEVHIGQLFDEVLALYRRKIEEKQLTIKLQYDSRQTAMAFPGGMRQVLSNLIVNAIEASPRGGSLYLRMKPSHRWADGMRGVRITIADNGSGMTAETRRALGRPFLTTKGQEGTGLGLWVTMSILRQHGARLQNRSSVDQAKHGTIFSIFLPATIQPTAFDTAQGGYTFEEAS